MKNEPLINADTADQNKNDFALLLSDLCYLRESAAGYFRRSPAS